MTQFPNSSRRLIRPTLARVLVSAVLSVAGMAAALPALAQQGARTVHPVLQDRWFIHLGLYTPNVDTTARLNGANGLIGTEVSFEEDLGYAERNDMPAILASVRLGESWRIEAEYLSLRRDNSHTLGRTINWGDSSFALGTVVSSEFTSDIFRLSAGYSFIKDTEKELGITLGFHVTDFRMSIAASGIGSETGEALAPLPTLGIYGAFAFTPQWLLSGRVDVFSLEYEEYDGSLVNVTAGVDYRLFRSLGIGAAYRYIDYDLNVTKSRLNGGINYRFSGPLLYLVSSF